MPGIFDLSRPPPGGLIRPARGSKIEADAIPRNRIELISVNSEAKGRSTMKSNQTLVVAVALLAGLIESRSTAADDRPPGRPNILWILAEDASPHIGCYGETAIATPRLDRLAREGVRFSNAFVTCPVCSPSRSALIAGMYQTTFGSHNHRSCNDDPKAGGNRAYYESYRVPESLQLIPELFAEAGYDVVNGGKGKEDYNFIARERALLRRRTGGSARRASRSSPRSSCMVARTAERKVAHPTDPAGSLCRRIIPTIP